MRRSGRAALVKGSKGYGTTRAIEVIRKLQERGSIKTRDVIIKEGERLDHLAARELGSSQLWWVLAVCSDIGWSLQVPPGTVIKVPLNLSDIRNVVE